MATRDKRSKVPRWRGVVMVNGKSKSKSFPTKQEAVAWEVATREEMKVQAKEETKTATGSVTLIEWQNAYLDYVGERFSRRTIDEKKALAKRLIKFFKKTMLVEEIGDAEVYRFLAHQNKTRGGNCANKDRKNGAAGWKFGRKTIKGFPRGENPFLEADTYPETRHPRYVPPENDFWDVYNKAEGQDRVVLLTLLHLGARKGEVFNLEVEDLDFENRTVRLWTEKRKGGNREFDLVPMTETLAAALKDWLKETRVKSEYVFVNQCDHHYSQAHWGKPFTSRQHWIHAVCRRAGVKAFTWHAIRHLTATILYKEGQPVSVIQRILRHKSPTTTARYMQRMGLAETREALVSVMDGRGTVIKTEE